MKKYLLYIASFFGVFIGERAFLSTSAITGALIFSAEKSEAQTFNSGFSACDTTWTVFQLASPTNQPCNRWEPLKVSKTSTWNRTKNIYFDSLATYPSTAIPGSAYIAFLNGTKLSIASPTLMPLANSQVTAGLGYEPLQTEVDGSTSNEIQTISGAGRTVSLNLGGGSYTVPKTHYDSLLGAPVNVSHFVNDALYLGVNQATFSLTDVNQLWLAGNSIFLPTQTISLVSGSLVLSNYGGTVALSSLTLTPSQVTTGLGYVPLQTEVDGSITNEIQTLSISGNSISISGGNTATLQVGLTTSITGLGGITVSGSAPNYTASLTDPITYYNASGTVAPTGKVWRSVVTPTASNGYTIDISSAGFSSITNISILAAKNSSLATSCPNPSIKSYNNGQVVVNIIEGNPSTVNILGSLVLLGAANVFADVTGLTLHVRVEGN